MDLKWQTCEKYTRSRLSAEKVESYSLGVACRPNMTVMLVMLWVFALLQ